jgi:hypothetical protein
LIILLLLAVLAAVAGIMAVVAVLAACLLEHLRQQVQQLLLPLAVAVLGASIIIPHPTKAAMEQTHHYQVGLLLRQQAVAAVAAE